MSPNGRAPADAGVLATARLTSSASTAVFRAMLDAIAHPGVVVAPVAAAPDTVPPVLLPVLALADLDVSVAVLGHDHDGGDERWAGVIGAVTGARIAAEIESADLVVALRAPSPAEVARMRRGDAFHPERGARVILACAALGGHGDDRTQLALSGPGTGDGRTVAVAGVDIAVIGALAERNREFPAGVDTWFVATDGVMLGLPRSVTAHIADGDMEAR